MKKLSLALLTCLCSSLSAGEFGFGVDGTATKLKGDFTYRGSKIDLKDDLMISKWKTQVVPKIFYKTGSHEVFVSYEALKFKGEGVLSRSIEFNNKIYTASDNIKSELSTKWGILGYRYHLKSYEKLQFDFGLDIHVINFKSKLETSMVDEAHDITAGLPTLNFGIMYNIDESVQMGASINGMPFGKYGHFVEYDAKAKMDIKAISGLSTHLGFKSKNISLHKDEDEEAKLSWNGMYAGFEYSF